MFNKSELATILKALEGWRTMIDDKETPDEDALIEKIQNMEFDNDEKMC